MPFQAIPRCFAALACAVAIVVVAASTRAQDANEGGEYVLILGRTTCGAEYADRLSLANCLQRQASKADRWMKAILESYARSLAKDMADVAQGGGIPFDTVAQLTKSQQAFETYREEASELAERAVIGTGGVFERSMAYFALTIGRARFVLDTCNHPLNSKLGDSVDLTLTAWCLGAQ
ncbi:MAG TPA: lysozyme inhibitor LprI family protein [Dongiaceae bacterium]|jgi:hypothetical protein